MERLHQRIGRGLHLGNIVGLVNLVLFGFSNLLGLVGLLVGKPIASPDGKREVDTALGKGSIATLDVLGEIEAANNDAGGRPFAPYLTCKNKTAQWYQNR